MAAFAPPAPDEVEVLADGQGPSGRPRFVPPKPDEVMEFNPPAPHEIEPSQDARGANAGQMSPLQLLNYGIDRATKAFAPVAAGALNTEVDQFGLFKRLLGHPLFEAGKTPVIWQLPEGTGEAVVKASLGAVLPLLDAGFLDNSPAVKGLSKVAQATLQGFTTPEGIAQVPLASFRAGRLVMAGVMAASTPEQLGRTMDTLKDEKASPEDKWAVLGESGVHLAMTAGLALHLGTDKVRDTMTPAEAAKAVDEAELGTNGAKPPPVPVRQEMSPRETPGEGTRPATSTPIDEASVNEAVGKRRNLTGRQIEILQAEPAEVQAAFLRLHPEDEPIGGAKGFADKLSAAQQAAKAEGRVQNEEIEPEPTAMPVPAANVPHAAAQQTQDEAEAAARARQPAPEAGALPGPVMAPGPSAPIRPAIDPELAMPVGSRLDPAPKVPQNEQFVSRNAPSVAESEQIVSQTAPKVAPVVFKGVQPGAGPIPSFNLWNLTEDVPGLGTKGSTLGEKTIREAGYEVPNDKGPMPKSASMGAGNARANAAAARATVAARAQTQAVGPIQTASRTLAGGPQAGGARPARPWFQPVRALFAPQTLGPEASQMSLVLRSAMGKEWQANSEADASLAEFRREFDKTPVPRNLKYPSTQVPNAQVVLPRNYEVMRAIDTGQVQNLTPVEQRFARAMRVQLDKAIAHVQEVSPNSLRNLMQDYMPRIWRDPELNGDKLNALMSKRPWEGSKGFLKQRVLQYFTDGLEMGLQPVSDNPVDVTMQKIGEMERFTAARWAMIEAKSLKLRRFFYWNERGPDGWRPVDDPTSQQFAPPTVTVKEAFDERVRVKTIEMLQSLKVPEERLTKLGGKRWGLASTPPDLVKTKFGGPDFVFWHEVGHIMDWRYPDLRAATLKAGNKAIDAQLRALADERKGASSTASFDKYIRSSAEKMANMFDAYLRAPDVFQRVAPDVWRAFNGWLNRHPQVRRPMDEIKPSLTLGQSSAEMYVGGPVLLGRWMMPEGAAQVVDNYLKPGLGKFKTFRELRDVSGLLNGVQLAGFFHGQFVLNDAFYSGFGLAAYDLMNGKPLRAAKELFQIPVSPVTSLIRGRKILGAIKDPDAATPEYRQLAQLAVETNLRAGHGTYEPEMARKWARAVRELRTAPSTGAAWESLWRAPFATVETGLVPVMKWLVPPMKMGIFARMAERVIADNPGIDQMELRKQLARAADSTEDRLGQVTYDNLFQRRGVKDAGQLMFRAYGWQLTKYRMIVGGAADWGRYASDLAKGRTPTVTFRMTYLPAMVAGHALIGGTIMYLLTGQRPQELKDYLFPKTGLKDANGKEVRLSIADFVKDIAADWRSFPNLSKMGTEWVRKLAPFWNMAAEMYRNQDFYGTEIFSAREAEEPWVNHALKNFGEGAAYMTKGVTPFSFTGGHKFIEAGADPTKARLAAFFGYNPAPRYAVQTPAESLAQDIASESNRGARTQEQAAHSQLMAKLVRDMVAGRDVPPEEQATLRGKRDAASLKQRLSMEPLQLQVRRMRLDDAMRVWDRADDKERGQLVGEIQAKMQNIAAGRSIPVDATKLRRYANMLTDWQAKMASQKQTSTGYSSFPK